MELTFHWESGHQGCYRAGQSLDPWSQCLFQPTVPLCPPALQVTGALSSLILSHLRVFPNALRVLLVPQSLCPLQRSPPPSRWLSGRGSAANHGSPSRPPPVVQPPSHWGLQSSHPLAPLPKPVVLVIFCCPHRLPPLAAHTLPRPLRGSPLAFGSLPCSP